MINDESMIGALHSLMGEREFLQPKGLIRRIADKTSTNPVDVRIALGKLARQGILEGVTHHGEPISRVSLTVAPPPIIEPETLSAWRRALHSCDLTADEMLALAPCHDRLQGFSDADLANLAKGLLALRNDQEATRGTPRFVLSARYLLGSSKLLNALPAPALRAFGIAIDTIPDAPPYVMVAGPLDPVAVLLIENPHSFEEAVAAGCAERVALIATFGYGLSRSGEAFGNSLVESIGMADQLVALVRCGDPPPPSTLLRHPEIFFWGDLDREGLRIYASLKKRLPTLRASALYQPMIEAIQRGQSHPYAKATAKDKQGAADTVPTDAAFLVPVCASRALDQEAISRTDIAILGAASL